MGHTLQSWRQIRPGSHLCDVTLVVDKVNPVAVFALATEIVEWDEEVEVYPVSEARNFAKICRVFTLVPIHVPVFLRIVEDAGIKEVAKEDVDAHEVGCHLCAREAIQRSVPVRENVPHHHDSECKNTSKPQGLLPRKILDEGID